MKMSKKQTDKANQLKGDTVTDLPVTEEQAADIKGGAETNRDFSGQIQVLSLSWGSDQSGSFDRG